MTCNFKRAIAVAILAASVVGTASRLHAAPVNLINDNFNSENGGTPQFNYNGFANFNVTQGAVDLINNQFVGGAIAGHGLFVDLDGTASTGGAVMQSHLAQPLGAGTYHLSFDLAGSNRAGSPLDSVTVSLGGLFSQSFTLPFAAPFTTQTFTITAGGASNGQLVFNSLGGDFDDKGLLLDNVLLTFDPAGGGPTPVPEPASFLLWGLGALGATCYERRRRAKSI